ncbi:SGNH/GDSL hydrolase family protein [Gimesia panareensis]|uniref:GDSL-like Lipase/Acylhydrolase n=1 Tax=Gimesia panareensis TaxID=2527978 RepID=A0A517QDQ7_9PLAN|nr:SGNH/GDSL hydrolase family protein [Gimesia panareensis]QDT29776.1 GDSL-like Lipase/Acylhydrolase [Gimesia panareensis]QDU52831.1 GDSL-like Lipase/Acylhydrolase [Gimesia panareensis]
MRNHPGWLLLIAALLLTPSFVNAAEKKDVSSQPLVLQDGDRIVFIGNTFADQLRLYNYLETLLTSHAPVDKLSFRNLAWSGDTLTLQPRPLNFGSLDDHLQEEKADVIIACFGMNESFAGPSGVKAYREHWEQFLKHLQSQKYNGKTPPRVAILSPIAHENMGAPLPDPVKHNQSLAEYTRVMQTVASEHQLPFVDLYSATQKLMEENPSQKLTHNGIHLNEYGYWAVSQLTAEQLLGKEVNSPQVLVDRQAETIEATNADVTQQKFLADKIQFTIKPRTLPVPAPPAGSIAHSELLAAQPRLTVKHLPEGNYRLVIDGTVILTGSASDWDRGLVLVKLPSQIQVADLRSIINRKNELFFYVYRAHNAEYIFGRRTKPFGAVSFPPEMETFGKLIAAREKTIQEEAQPLQAAECELIRVD